jgi:ankyrin repeat protein
MGCGCSKKTKKVTYAFTPVLDDMRSTAKNFVFWELVLGFLDSDSLQTCRLLNRRFYRTIVVPLKQKPLKAKKVAYTEMLMSAHSLLTQADSFKLGRDESLAMTPINAADRSQTGSPFFSEVTMRSVLSVTSRTPTPFRVSGGFKFVHEFRPVIEDLEEAIRDGNVRALESLLKDIVDRSSQSLRILRQNKTVELEMTLLGLVVLTGSNNMTELILTLLENIDIDEGITIKRTELYEDRKIYAGAMKVTYTKLSPLKLAASRGFDRIVSKLLIMGADLTLKGVHVNDKLISITETDFGPSPLAICLQSYFKELPFDIGVEVVHPVSDWLSCVEQLLLAGDKLEWKEGLMCLKDLSMLRLIVKYCADLEDPTGTTLLESAELHPNQDAVEVLLEAGHRVTTHAMLCCPYVKIEQFAKAYTDSPSVTYLAIKASDFRMLNRLLCLGYQIDLQETFNGYNALQLVAQQKSWNLLRILKQHCSLEALTQAATARAYGGTVMWLALPDLDFLMAMVEVGGSIQDLSFVPVYRTYFRNESLLSCIVKLGIDIEGKDEAGLTAFWHAYADAKIVQQRRLKAYGADVNCRNPDGYTPLLDSCLKGYYLQAKLLIDLGADTTLKSPQGLGVQELASYPHELKRMAVVGKLCSLFPK